MTEHGPGPMVEPPLLVTPHQHRHQQMLDATGKDRITGSWILYVIQFLREASKIMDGAWSRHGCHRSARNIPVRRNCQHTDPQLFGPYPLNAPGNVVVQAPVGDLKLLSAKDVYSRFQRARARFK